jgi:class 3 adenylate cyclase
VSLDAARLTELGLYDPTAADGEQRLELLEFLQQLGAGEEDLVSYRDELAGLASVVALRGGRALTVAEVVERSGVSEEKVRRLNRAAGFPDPGSDDRVFSEQFAGVFGALSAAEAVFGEETVTQLVRVIGAAMARIADAVVSSFLIHVEPAVRDADPVGLGIARANAEAAALVPGVMGALDVLFRQHIVAARRSGLGLEAETHYETQRMTVGFVDLVGSTALAQRLTTEELGALLTEFENTAADTVTAHGGRVVKLIGDEVLYTAPDEHTGSAIAFELVRTYGEHPRIPAVRAGLASGDLLLRDGDVFGPVVNLAARAVGAAGAGEVVAPTAFARDAGLTARCRGAQTLKGLDSPVELSRLIGSQDSQHNI